MDWLKRGGKQRKGKTLPWKFEVRCDDDKRDEMIQSSPLKLLITQVGMIKAKFIKSLVNPCDHTSLHGIFLKINYYYYYYYYYYWGAGGHVTFGLILGAIVNLH